MTGKSIPKYQSQPTGKQGKRRRAKNVTTEMPANAASAAIVFVSGGLPSG
jgi:hypothetical protein